MSTMNTISIKGLDKAKVLAVLYNRARPQGLGYLHFTPDLMTVDEAQILLAKVSAKSPNYLHFDYVKGRVMKVDLSGDELYTALYNRDNGPSAAEEVIIELKQSHEPKEAI